MGRVLVLHGINLGKIPSIPYEISNLPRMISQHPSLDVVKTEQNKTKSKTSRMLPPAQIVAVTGLEIPHHILYHPSHMPQSKDNRAKHLKHSCLSLAIDFPGNSHRDYNRVKGHHTDWQRNHNVIPDLEKQLDKSFHLT